MKDERFNTGCLIPIAHEILGKLDEVACAARAWLNNPKAFTIDSLVPIAQTEKAALKIAKINQQNRSAYLRLSKEPLASRVIAEAEDGKTHTYFFCRADQGMVDLGVISYLTDFGRLAATPVGGDFITPLGEHWIVVSKTGVRSETARGIWDAFSVIQRKGRPSVTVESLRALLEVPTPSDMQDILEQILSKETQRPLAMEGIRRSVIARMGLRDQPIMDKFQDEIFRLPLSSKILVLGPPGTGKTTTLIRRLGQKLDVQFLDEDEQRVAKEVGASQHLPHESSWLMFTPTELLRQYLKEAFAREGVPAPDRNIRTWDEHRRELCRQTFAILKTAAGGGIFISKTGLSSLQDTALNNPIDLFHSFDTWQRDKYWRELASASEVLRDSPKRTVSEMGKRLTEIVIDDQTLPSKLSSLVAEVAAVQTLVAKIKRDTDLKVHAALVAQLEQNGNFLTEFAAFLNGLQQTDVEDADDADGYKEDDAQAPKAGGRAAASIYMQVLKTLARNSVAERSDRVSGRMAEILEWLKGRTLSVAGLRAIGKQLILQAAARQFVSPVRRYIDGLARRYSSFRRESQASGKWYQPSGFNDREISPLELDAILLAILRGCSELINRPTILRNIDNPIWAPLNAVMGCYRHQILVDEATDFSPLQLACMGALAHPRLRSIFACGDFNQRLTTWGVRSPEELSWSIPGLDVRSVNIAYRQSRQLNELSRDIIQAVGGSIQLVNLPAEVDNDIVAPVLLENSSAQATVRWVAARIADIERLVLQLPSIAVLVNCEADVDPTAKALEALLADHNIRVTACREGQAVGQESSVRVFDIQHIKGMEFEAVFFVGVDRLSKSQPELFDKYIYVGATRAAAYLGLACEGILPQQLESVRHHFVSNWSNDESQDASFDDTPEAIHVT